MKKRCRIPSSPRHRLADISRGSSSPTYRNVDPSIIATLVNRLVEAAAPLRPSLVYLARRDPDVAFRAIAERRGLAWLLHHAANSNGYAFTQARGLSGLEGLLAYWRAHAELCGAIVERLDVPKLAVEVGPDGWSECRRRICDFVEVPFEMVEGRLVLRGILWASNALLPVAPNVFDIESWPLRLSFTGDTAERIDTALAGLLSGGPAPAISPLTTS